MELIERCKRAIAENRCLGCTGLAEKDWIPPKKCPYLPSAEESIKQIKLNLRNGEKMKYEDMLNTITLGDSYELIKYIPDNSIDLIVTDPPYEIITSGAGILKDRKTRFLDNIENKFADGINEKILDEFCRVMKKTNIYIWCSRTQVKKYLDYFLKKVEIYDILIWHKTNPVPTINGTYLSDKEYCLFFRDKKATFKLGTVESKRTVWTTKCNVDDKKKIQTSNNKTITNYKKSYRKFK